MSGVHDEIPVYPFIGPEIPAPARATEPGNVRAERFAFHEAAPQGVILSRSLMGARTRGPWASGQDIREIRQEEQKQ